MLLLALNTLSLTITGLYSQRENFISFQSLSFFEEVSVSQQQKEHFFSQEKHQGRSSRHSRDVGRAQYSWDKQ